MRHINIELVAIVFLFLGCYTEESERPLIQFDGIQEVKLIKANEISPLVETYSGKKAVLMNIWATWCVPCVEEFPYLVRLQKEYPNDLEVIFISADFPEELERINQFLTQNEVDWQTYLKDDRDEPFIDAVWTEWSGALPATVVYNKNGTRLTAFERPAKYEEFKELVLQAIDNSKNKL
jgi:thiol-disulfide isomerase/thioredoxin